jgi:hypothetical protein
MWFLGPMVGAVVVVGLALERDRPRRELLRLAAVPALSVIAAALTPVGPRLLALPFTVGGYAGLVSEWRPPDIHEPYVAVTVALLVVTALTWARSPVRVPWYDVLLWTVAVGWTLVYARTVAVGAVVVAPLAAGALQRIASVTATGSPRWERAAVASAAVVAAIGALFLAPSLARGPAGVPSALGSAVDALPRGTVVLNDEALGGWLLLEHPGVAPVVDTRNHLFAPPYVERYVRARAGLDGWESFVTDTGARAALVREGEPLVAALPDRLGWTVVKRADGYVLLAAPAS